MSLEHPNKSRVYKKGVIHNARPGDKGFRKPINPEYIKLAKEMKELMEYFHLDISEISDIIKREFGEGVGIQTTQMFMDQTYGPAFNLREKTADKYKYVVAFLKKTKKEFAL